VSGKHCELTFKDGFWVVRDLDSTNGTKVNALRVSKKVLRAGDFLTIGKRKFKIQYQESGQASKLDEYENEMEEAMNMSLLEKAGLAKPEAARKRRENAGPNQRRKPIMDDDDDDDD
jgi:pSer/pThr/pTyr-binding forkhead associated (FHA) protein